MDSLRCLESGTVLLEAEAYKPLKEGEIMDVTQKRKGFGAFC